MFCSKCGNQINEEGLCPECGDEGTIAVSFESYEKSRSFKSFIQSPLGKLVIIAVVYLISFGLLVLSVQIGNAYMFAGILIACAIGGWHFLEKINLGFLISLPLVGWLIYFVFKLWISMMIGFFVTPFFIAGKISNAVKKI